MAIRMPISLESYLMVTLLETENSFESYLVIVVFLSERDKVIWVEEWKILRIHQHGKSEI